MDKSPLHPVLPRPGDGGMPLPGNGRRTKAARKKSATDKGKTKKSDSTGKDKTHPKGPTLIPVNCGFRRISRRSWLRIARTVTAAKASA